MRSIHLLSSLAIVMTCSSSALAGGLIQKLPKDGAWVKFHMEHRREGTVETKNTGHWIIRSVGVVTVDDRKCRWVEFDRLYGETATGIPAVGRLIKFLVPEKELPGRGDPLATQVRSWYRFRVGMNQPRKPYKLTGPQLYGDNMMLLPSAPKNSPLVSLKVGQVKKPRAFACQKGKLQCKSAVRETYEFTESDTTTGAVIHRSSVTFTLWKHKAVPFGVAGASVDFKRFGPKGKDLARKNTLELTVTDFGTKAKSAIPESK